VAVAREVYNKAQGLTKTRNPKRLFLWYDGFKYFTRVWVFLI